MSCGAEIEASNLLTALTVGEDFELPDVDLSDPEFQVPFGADSLLYKDVVPLTNADLVVASTDGDGTFNALMGGFRAYIESEFKASRITGAEYTKTYIALSQSAMAGAVQFLLGRDAAAWDAIGKQIQAVTARVQLETAKAQLVALQYEASNRKAEYALTKMKLATESMAYCTAKYNLEQTLPVQLGLLASQKLGQDRQNEILSFNLTSMLPQQLLLVREQTEVQRAQTMDFRNDGNLVSGTLGKQKALYTQQITSYQRDAEVKAAKLFTDAWITQKTIDEGLLPPDGFTNASLDTVLAKLKINNGLT